MKGISPVITTVLLLLMAVAAVGGAWVWYQRMQTSAMAGGSGQVDQLRRTAVSISPDKLTCATGNYDITLANIGTDAVTLTQILLDNSTGTVGTEADAADLLVPSNELTTITVTAAANSDCITGLVYYVDARVGAQYIIRDYPVTAQ